MDFLRGKLLRRENASQRALFYPQIGSLADEETNSKSQ